MEYVTGKILTVPIDEEMKRSYIDYAMSVIVARALPDVRDGLKPVQRRILYAMYEMGLTPDKPHRKSARVVGEVMGKYHPHGDMPIYDALVRMAQDFSFRYPLVDGHGNFGSVDGDAAGAMRYTEARLAPLAMEMLRDIERETVDFGPNFDDSLREPVVLPARFPQLLANGAAGIAVGMATNIPPHNLGELIDAIIHLIDNPEADTEDLMRFIPGPDFPTGGLILGRQGIREAYATGRGVIVLRAAARVERGRGGRARIVVTELPYQLNKARLLERIAELVREKRIDGIADLRDESDRSGMRVVVELRREATPRVVLNQLYKHTPMQQSYGIILLALVDGQPQVLTLRQMIREYIKHQQQLIVRRTRYELRKAQDRAHVLEGLRVALAHLDEVITLIKRAPDVPTARTQLMERFQLSERQAQAILDMRLQRLTGLEREKLESEYQQLLRDIDYFRAVLASDRMVLDILKRELTEIRERFADPRRTRITDEEAELGEEDLIPDEDVVITITHRGYAKRLALNTYRSQRRGGKGVTGVTTRDGDFVEHLFITSTHRYLLFITNWGKAYRLKVHEIPEASRVAKGTALVNLLAVDPDEVVNAVLSIREFSGDLYVAMVTRRGWIKKTRLADLESSRQTGIRAIILEDGDELVAAHLTDGRQELIVGTAGGYALRFSEEEVRPTGRAARGVTAMRLRPGDEVVGMDTVIPGADLLVVTERGYGKRTPLDEYRVRKRGGMGVRAARITKSTGRVAALRVVREGTDVMLVSARGMVIRLGVGEISRMGRATRGVTVMDLVDDDQVVALAQATPEQ